MFEHCFKTWGIDVHEIHVELANRLNDLDYEIPTLRVDETQVHQYIE